MLFSTSSFLGAAFIGRLLLTVRRLYSAKEKFSRCSPLLVGKERGNLLHKE